MQKNKPEDYLKFGFKKSELEKQSKKFLIALIGLQQTEMVLTQKEHFESSIKPEGSLALLTVEVDHMGYYDFWNYDRVKVTGDNGEYLFVIYPQENKYLGRQRDLK